MSGEPQPQPQQQQLSIAELRDIAARQQAHIDEQLRTLRQREGQMTELAGWAAAAAAAAVGNSGGDPRQRRRHLQQLAASVDAQAERLRRQRSIRQQLAHYRHANAQLGRELASARAECQARQEEMVALAAKLDAMHRQAAAIAASASQPPPQQQQQQQQHQRQNSRPLPPLPPLPPPPQRKQQTQQAAQQPQEPPPALLQRRRPPPQAPPSPPPSHRRHTPPAPAATSASAMATAASSATATELLLSRDRLDDLIRREATALPHQRDSLVVQDPADQAEAAEAKAEAAAAAAAAAAEAAECKESEKPSAGTATPGSETDSSGEEDPACLTEEPPSLHSSGNRRRDDPPGAPTGWLAPIAKLDDEDDLSLSDFDEASGKPGGAAPVVSSAPAAAVPGILSNGKKKNSKAKSFCKPTASDGEPDSAGADSQQRSVTFDPLTLLLDAAIEGDLQQVQRYTGQLGDPCAASAEGITALHNAVCAGHSRIVQYLIDSGADVNAADQDGWTPLHCAVSCDSLPLTKLLVGSGAVLHCTTHSESETPFDLCHNGGPVEAWLRAEENRLGVDNSGRVFAAFDYSPEQTDELSLARGDQLTVLRKGDGAETAWWWCRQDGDAVKADGGEELKEGYVARNFVSLYKSHG